MRGGGDCAQATPSISDEHQDDQTRECAHAIKLTAMRPSTDRGNYVCAYVYCDAQ